MPSATGSFLFYSAVISFTLGIFVRSFFIFGLATITWLVMLALMVVLVDKTRLFFISLIILCFAAGALRMEVASWTEINSELEEKLHQQIEITGTIKREPEQSGYSTKLYVQNEQDLILAFASKYGDWEYGDRVTISGRLEKPESFETDLGRIFNYPGYLLAHGVSYVIRDAEVVVQSGEADVASFAALYRFKKSFIVTLQQLIPEPTVALGEGLLLGVKGALGDDLEESFRRSGIIHIVVLSGYNVMLVVAFVLYILGSIFGRRLSTFFGIIGIVAFAILVGLGATVVRASIMAGLLLIMGLTGRVYLVLRGLCLAGVLMLLWNPYALAFDVGFQLSFLATLGLILMSPHIEKYLQWFPNWFGSREFLVATLATQLFVLPLLLYQIGQFSLVSVLVNVVVLPMVPLAMLLTFITGMVGLLSLTWAMPFAYLAQLSLTYIVKTAEMFSSWSLAAFTVPAFPFWLVPVGYALIAWLWWRLNREPDALLGWVIVEEN